MKTRKNNKRVEKQNCTKKQIGGVLEEDVCPICTDNFTRDKFEVLSTTKCGHTFHTKCIQNWCNTQQNNYTIGCPICRSNIKPLCLQISKNERLSRALDSGNVQDALDLLVSADINNTTNSHRISPLVLACINQNLGFEVVKLLIEFGADVNPKNSVDTPLMASLDDSIENLKIMNLLIENGADVNATGEVEYGETKPLIEAINLNMYDCVELLLKKGADVNIRDNYGGTPLINTMVDKYPGQENLNIVKLLLKQPNINIDLTIPTMPDDSNYNGKTMYFHGTYNNKTALEIANEQGFTEISKLIKPIMESRIKEVIEKGKTKDGRPLIQRAHPEVKKYVGDYFGGKSNRKTRKNRKK